MKKDFLEDLDLSGNYKSDKDYTTGFSYLAAVLLYHNYQVKNVFWEDYKATPFYVFSDTKGLMDIVDKYHKKQIKCEPQQLFYCFREIMRVRDFYRSKIDNLDN